MKPLIIFGHPNSNTFNGEILKTVKDFFVNKGIGYKISNLYEMNFNPVLSLEEYQNRETGNLPADIKEEQEKVTWADTLIFIYPVWWSREPAIVKGWIDRVLSKGFAYEENNDGIRGLLSGKKGAVICTFAASQDAVEKAGILESMHIIMSQATLGFCGVESVINQAFFEIPETSSIQHEQMLQQVTQLLEKL